MELDDGDAKTGFDAAKSCSYLAGCSVFNGA